MLLHSPSGAEDIARDDGPTALRRSGLRSTPPRLTVLEILRGDPDRPHTVEGIAQDLLRQGRPAALATLYAAVRSLVDHGLVERSRFDGGRGLFWLKQRQAAPLHQIVCKDCQRGFVAVDQDLAAHIARLCAQNSVPMGSKSVLVQMQCAECLSAASASHPPLRRALR